MTLWVWEGVEVLDKRRGQDLLRPEEGREGGWVSEKGPRSADPSRTGPKAEGWSGTPSLSSSPRNPGRPRTKSPLLSHSPRFPFGLTVRGSSSGQR